MGEYNHVMIGIIYQLILKFVDTYGSVVHRTTNDKFWKPFEGIYGLFWQIFWPKVVISAVFAFYVPIIPEIWNLQAPFLPGGGRKGRLGASSLSERFAPSPDYAKVLDTAVDRASLVEGRRQDSYRNTSTGWSRQYRIYVLILFHKKVPKTTNLKTDLVVSASSSKFQPRLRLHEGQ